MKRLGFLIAFLFTSLGFATVAQEAPVTFYLQLVRGNDHPTPPAAGAKTIGPKLS